MPEEPWRPFTIEDALSIRTFSDRAPIRFSPDGRLLAYSLECHSSDELCDQVWVTDVESGQARPVLPGGRTAWGVSWSPVRSTLLPDEIAEGRVWLWKPERSPPCRPRCHASDGDDSDAA